MPPARRTTSAATAGDRPGAIRATSPVPASAGRGSTVSQAVATRRSSSTSIWCGVRRVTAIRQCAAMAGSAPRVGRSTHCRSSSSNSPLRTRERTASASSAWSCVGSRTFTARASANPGTARSMASPPPAKTGPRKDSPRRRRMVVRPMPGPPASTTSPGSASAARAVTSGSAGRSAGWSPASPRTGLPSPSAGTNMGSCAGRIFVVWSPQRQRAYIRLPGGIIMSDGYDTGTDHDPYHDDPSGHDHHDPSHDPSHDPHNDPYGHDATVVTADYGHGTETLIDTNKDGYADVVDIDADGDGDIDAEYSHTFGSGHQLNTLAVDTNNDGRPDLVEFDRNHDGHVDQGDLDRNYDGHVDTVHYTDPSHNPLSGLSDSGHGSHGTHDTHGSPNPYAAS